MTTFNDLLGIDRALAAAGYHPLTDFWRDTLERYYTHSTARTLVGRVGRGGAKSFTSAKVGLTETLLGDFKVPPGERHIFAFVSKTKDEASQRNNLLKSFLDKLGVPYNATGDEIALVNMPRGFRVFACNVGAVSGFRCIGYAADELAKWVAGSDYQNPASEVCASLNAMCATHATAARRLLISSPLGLLDYHAEQFELGETAHQITAWAPSWVANPDGVTEAATRILEPDERVWRREYGAVPSAAVNAALDPSDVERAFASVPPGYFTETRWIGVQDPSSLRGDSYTWCRVGVLQPDPFPQAKKVAPGQRYPVRVVDATGRVVGTSEEIATSHMTLRDERGELVYEPVPTRPLLRIEQIGAVEGRVIGELSMADVVRRVVTDLDVVRIFSDQREDASLLSMFGRHGIAFESFAWTAASKPPALALLRRLLREGSISIEASDGAEKLKQQLFGLEERLMPSGHYTYGARRGAHDDFAALLITTMMAINARKVPGAETWVSHQKIVSMPQTTLSEEY